MPPSTLEVTSVIARGLAATKAMGRNVAAEHSRWNLPLLAWKQGKVTTIKPDTAPPKTTKA